MICNDFKELIEIRPASPISRPDSLQYTQTVTEMINRIRDTCTRNGWDPLNVLLAEILINGINTSAETMRIVKSQLSMSEVFDLDNIRMQIHNASGRELKAILPGRRLRLT